MPPYIKGYPPPPKMFLPLAHHRNTIIGINLLLEEKYSLEKLVLEEMLIPCFHFLG